LLQLIGFLATSTGQSQSVAGRGVATLAATAGAQVRIWSWNCGELPKHVPGGMWWNSHKHTQQKSHTYTLVMWSHLRLSESHPLNSSLRGVIGDVVIT